jgi:hypothetical protein
LKKKVGDFCWTGVGAGDAGADDGVRVCFELEFRR